MTFRIRFSSIVMHIEIIISSHHSFGSRRVYLTNSFWISFSPSSIFSFINSTYSIVLSYRNCINVSFSIPSPYFLMIELVVCKNFCLISKILKPSKKISRRICFSITSKFSTFLITFPFGPGGMR